MQPDQSPDLRSEAWVTWAGRPAAPAPATELAELARWMRTVSGDLQALAGRMDESRAFEQAWRGLQ